jgi:tRNA (Thr-GGU) A37 N-methylase
MLDGTPLLDLKPYLPEFEPVEEIRRGWLEDAAWKAQSARSDRRFSPDEPPDQAAKP